MKYDNLKTVLVSASISIIFFSFVIFVFDQVHNVNPKSQIAQALNFTANNTDGITRTVVKTTTLYFVGDIMLTRGVESSVEKNFGGDYNKLFDNLVEFRNADILFGNLEGDVSDVGNNVGSKYSFRMNPAVLPALKNAGFSVVSFSNNHVGDWNMDAFKDTLSRLSSANILKTGAGMNKEDAETPAIIEKNGVRFGFISFSDVGPDWLEAKTNNPGILLASDPNFETIIQNAKTKCDVLIVSFHFGVEYELTHNNRQESLAHSAIDNGADMVVGGHPHVMEDIEEYKGKTIVYSLGNFIFDQYFSDNTMKGMLFETTFSGTNLIKTEQKIITLNKYFQPEGIFNPDEVKKVSKPKVQSTDCQTPEKTYDDMSMLNIGKNNGLPDMTYIPKDLEEVEDDASVRGNICLVKDAKSSFEQMVKDAKSAGYYIKASSGFRSYDTQSALIANAIDEGKDDVSISLAKPGYSEHQLGTTVDITSSSIGYDSASGEFYKTPESDWLKNNAYLYGFIQSYPSGKEDITGYKSEPWHYRYVGIENAKKIKDSGLTTVEFLSKK